jgi:hypothetical protein
MKCGFGLTNAIPNTNDSHPRKLGVQMMKALLNGIGSAIVVLVLTIHVSQAAAPIIKLDLAKTPAPDPGPDIIYTGAVLATPPDGNNLTTGLQDTAIVFGDFLSPLFAARAGSYSLQNLTTNGPASTVAVPGGTLVFQPMKNGNFQVYDNNLNALLLDVDLTPSSTLLTGSLNSPTGGLITVTNGKAVGGALLGYVDPNSISFSISLSNILSNGGTVGHFVLDSSNVLTAFQASATKEIGANPNPLGSPEPSSAVLLALGSLCGAIFRRRR